MAPSVRNALATLVALCLLGVTGCGGSNSLSGTRWKGGNMYDENVRLTFESERDCTIMSIVGSEQCTYSVSGQQVSVTLKSHKGGRALHQNPKIRSGSPSGIHVLYMNCRTKASRSSESPPLNSVDHTFP